ncbi:TolC family protein [Simplicispira psychrophila]|uniref:TolC family protein n=1 Tax=Simplicispira psychrophila TaxID=80882 RepID=UPI000481C979|nr:TolC family protein [Simplicispira psychrophila]
MILWGWHLGPFATALERTDNAYVRGQITVLAPQVNGYVVEVLAHDFEKVQAGQALVHIDDRIYTEKVHAAQAQLQSARAQLANAAQTQAQNQANLGSRGASLMAAQAEARRDQAAFTYRGAALAAFAEVENALVGVERLQQQMHHAVQRRDVLARSLQYAKDRYDAGYAPYLEQLDAQRALYQTEIEVINLRQSQLLNQLSWYKALGGRVECGRSVS